MRDTLARTQVAEAACMWGTDVILLARERSTSWVSLPPAARRVPALLPALDTGKTLRKNSPGIITNIHDRTNRL